MTRLHFLHDDYRLTKPSRCGYQLNRMGAQKNPVGQVRCPTGFFFTKSHEKSVPYLVDWAGFRRRLSFRATILGFIIRI